MPAGMRFPGVPPRQMSLPAQYRQAQNRVKQAQRNRVKEGKGTKERDPVQVRARVHACMLEMQQCRLCRLVMRKMSLTAEDSRSGPPLPFYADPVFSK